ncbi:YcnI family protein [Micromonospora sp. WMMD987]|uniref:YcnI family protein n=1 Tax=Micromonospora sp. WMMD987 TaxID=3016089 RepID=UPI00249BFBF4|nr:YcnI family protein [Micromonospora sp. WMMD987]WFE93718.1 YcnI family protein [Micromonospora sp. WMMD987]
MATTRGDARRRRSVLVLAAVAAGVFGAPGAALADGVTSSPSQAVQGDAVELTFVVPEERAGARTEKIEFRLPEDAPVGEVYPLSVDGWAPLITSRELAAPVAGIHAPSVSTVTSAVVWTRGAGPAVPGPARLSVAMGPLPQLDRMTFEVVQTYSDGTVVRWADPAGGGHPAPTLTLVPPAPGAATGGHHGGAADATDAQAAPDAAAPAGDDGDGGPSADLLLGGGLLVGLGGGAAIGWVASRSRRRAAADAQPDGDDEATPDAGSAPVDRGWRLDGHAPAEAADTAPERVAAR